MGLQRVNIWLLARFRLYVIVLDVLFFSGNTNLNDGSSLIYKKEAKLKRLEHNGEILNRPI